MNSVRRLGQITLVAALLAQATLTAAQGGRQATATTQPGLSGTALILGRVVDAGDNSPVSGAVVTLTGTGASAANAPIPAGGVAGAGSFPLTPQARRILTDGQGRFSFRDLPAGVYSFVVTVASYTGGGYGQRRVSGPSRPLELDANEKVGDVTLRVWKLASISGTIIDESGEPAVGVAVKALRQVVAANKKRLGQTNVTAITDDRGFYRLGAMIPGDYVVVVPSSVATLPASTLNSYYQFSGTVPGTNTPAAGAAIVDALRASGGPLPSANGMRVGEFQVQMTGPTDGAMSSPPPGEDGRLFVYQTVYHPSATTAAQATIISLDSGEEHVNADIQLRLTPSARVSGIVTDASGGVANLGLRLMPAGAEDLVADAGFETATTVTDGGGSFTFLGVPAGAYTIKALRIPRPTIQTLLVTADTGRETGVQYQRTQATATAGAEPTMWGQASVSVNGSNLSGVAIALRPGLKVTGRVEFDGTSEAPTADQLQRASVSLASTENRSSTPAGGKITADLQFATNGYAPGQYAITASGPFAGWTLQSAMIGARDLSVTAIALEDTDISGVVIRFTDHPTELNGTVHASLTSGDVDASVFVFPADYKTWIGGGASARLTRSAIVSKSGAYATTGLPPGEYCVIAVSLDVATDVRDLKFYDTLARAATRVRLQDGEKRTVDLQVSGIR